MIVIGQNGVGKSNLLESVELLSSLRSYRSNRNQDLIYWDQEKASLTAIIEDDQKLSLELNRKGGRKAYKNEKLLIRQMDLIGPMRSVGFSALDLELIRGEPSLRRNWLDRIVQQLEPLYSDLIGRFSRLLKQRSRLWRNLSLESNKDQNILLDSFDIQMALVSTRIHRRRRRILNRLLPIASSWQKHLSNNKEQLNIQYEVFPCCYLDVVASLKLSEVDDLKYAYVFDEFLYSPKPFAYHKNLIEYFDPLSIQHSNYAKADFFA